MNSFFRNKKRIICLFAPIFFGLIYFALCVADLNRSIWFDESYGAHLVRFNFGQIWHFTANDVHPPLYYFLLKAWSHFFGHYAFSMRMLSVLFGVVAIFFAYKWLKYKYGAKAACIGGLLMSTSPFIVRYGQEMRMYTLVLALVFAGLYVLQLAIDTKQKKWWAIYSIIVALGMWTHYFVALAWVAQLIYLICIYKKKIFQKHIIFTYVAAVLMFLPWFPYVIMQFGSVQSGFWIPPVSMKAFADYWSEITLYGQSDSVKDYLAIVSILQLVSLVILAIKARKKIKALLLLALIPPAILFVISMPPASSVFVNRYLFYSAAAIMLLEAVSLVLYYNSQKKNKKNEKRFALICGLIFVVSNICGLCNVYSIGNYNFTTANYPTANKFFDDYLALRDNEESLIVDTPWLFYDMSFYSDSEKPVYFINSRTDYIYGSLLPLKESYFGRIDNEQQFISENDAFWYVGEDGDNELKSPFEGYEKEKIVNLNYDEHGLNYELIKFVKK